MIKAVHYVLHLLDHPFILHSLPDSFLDHFMWCAAKEVMDVYFQDVSIQSMFPEEPLQMTYKPVSGHVCSSAFQTGTVVPDKAPGQMFS